MCDQLTCMLTWLNGEPLCSVVSRLCDLVVTSPAFVHALRPFDVAALFVHQRQRSARSHSTICHLLNPSLSPGGLCFTPEGEKHAAAFTPHKPSALLLSALCRDQVWLLNCGHYCTRRWEPQPFFPSCDRLLLQQALLKENILVCSCSHVSVRQSVPVYGPVCKQRCINASPACAEAQGTLHSVTCDTCGLWCATHVCWLPGRTGVSTVRLWVYHVLKHHPIAHSQPPLWSQK